MKKIIIGIGGIIVLGVVYYLASPLWRTVKLEELAPVQTAVESSQSANLSGNFVSAAHEVSGKATIVEAGGKQVLHFEDFKTLNGPDLRIYLSADGDAKDFVDLGAIRATEGSVNYEIPAGTDLVKYNQVLVWCRTFRVLFGSASLQSI